MEIKIFFNLQNYFYLKIIKKKENESKEIIILIRSKNFVSNLI